MSRKKKNNAPNTRRCLKRKKTFSITIKKWHTIGRIWNTIGILLIIAVPIVACIHLKVSPNWAIFADGGIITLIIINLGSGISEPVIYAPMLGTNGEYLAFITGNLSNLKIPCVVKAHEIAETELGTEENELVSTIAVAISSLVTVLIIAVMVLCLAVSPLQQSIEKAPYLTPAFGCVVYALFGSLGGKYIVKNPKMAVIPGAILIGLSALISGVSHGKTNIGSLSLMVGIVFCALFAFAQIMINKKKAKKAAATETIDVGIDSDEKKSKSSLKTRRKTKPKKKTKTNNRQ
ncbi:MAG: hypothetical protein L6V85_10365 [Clostridiales bacterium]|nr:MAG: hypothetical protein L6V85_10365 [Clostridiales bacterium]